MICVWVCAQGCRPVEGGGCLEPEFRCMWAALCGVWQPVRPSAKAVPAVNCWALSPAPAQPLILRVAFLIIFQPLVEIVCPPRPVNVMSPLFCCVTAFCHTWVSGRTINCMGPEQSVSRDRRKPSAQHGAWNMVQSHSFFLLDNF